MLATMLHGMQGTPYIYQGEELGMTNVHFPIEMYEDLEIKNMYQERLAQGYDPADVMESIYARGRDNARTPMQWSGEEYAGFSHAAPWLPVNPNYTEINAQAALADPNSVFYYYQRLIALRKEYPVFREGRFTLLEMESEQLFVYTRDIQEEHLLVVCNFTDKEVPFTRPTAFEQARLLLSNYGDVVEWLRPYEAQLFYLRG